MVGEEDHSGITKCGGFKKSRNLLGKYVKNTH